MNRCGVLIVDDSAFIRRAVSLLFERDPECTIVGIARNGLEAIEKSERLKPDVITMDVEMPEMDGLTALEHIMRENPLPVVMLSSQSGEQGLLAAIRSLDLGAVDFFLKERLLTDTPVAETVADFLERVKRAAGACGKKE